MRTIFYWLILLSIPVAISGYVVFRKQVANRLQPVAAEPLTEHSILTYPAQIETAAGLSRLSSLKVGRVVSVAVEVGADLSAGETILTLDDTQARSAIKTAALDLRLAKVNLENARQAASNYPLKLQQQNKQLVSTQSTCSQAEVNLEIIRKRFQLRETSAEEVRIAEAKLAQARGAIELEEIRLQELKNVDSQLEVDLRQAQVESAEVVLQLVTADLDNNAIRAPGNGRVIELRSRVGELAGPNVPSVVFQIESELVVRIEVEQVHVNQITANMPVTVRDYHHRDQYWRGQIERIGTEFVAAKGARPGSTEFSDIRVVECVASLDNDAKGVRVGQKVWVEISPVDHNSSSDQ